MNCFEATHVYDGWLQILAKVMDRGEVSKPRGLEVRELLGTQVVITDLRYNLIFHPERALNYRFAIAEWLWILAGRDDVAFVARYNKQIAKFSDDGVTFAGAYGPRLSPQWPWLLDKLREDPDSRQAVATIWTPRPQGSRDIPCTTSLQVLIRGGKLHGIFTMRSQDLWLGFVYDTFNFCQLVNGLAGQLGLECGSLTLNVGSSHVYATNFEQVERVLRRPIDGYSVLSPKLRRVPPAYFMTQIVEGKIALDNYPEHCLNREEYAYVQALLLSTSADALEILEPR